MAFKKGKLCIDCGEEKKIEARKRCKTCYVRWYRKAFPKKYKANLKKQHKREHNRYINDEEFRRNVKARNRKKDIKKAIIKRKKIMKMGNRCEDCGITNHFILCVHHGVSKEIVLCHNCHHLRHITYLENNNWKKEVIEWILKNNKNLTL